MVYAAEMLKASGPARRERQMNLFIFKWLIGKMWTYADKCGQMQTFLWAKRGL
jgi:hypothetical protein